MCQRTRLSYKLPSFSLRSPKCRKRGEKEAINYHDPSEFDLRVSRAFLSQTQHLLPHCGNVVFVDAISPSLHRDSERKKEGGEGAGEIASGWIKIILLSETVTDLRRKVSSWVTDFIKINIIAPPADIS